MAEIPMNGPIDVQNKRQSVGVAANYAGAIVSLALIVGIGTWGYKLLARDVSGVPVVRAVAETPMRIVPESPGGSEAEHQGLSVNKVMAEGGAGKPADKLVLAPKPVELTAEDTPLEIKTGTEPRQVVTPKATELELDVIDEPLSPQMASIKALADQLANGVAPLAEDDVVDSSGEGPEVLTQVVAAAPVVVADPVVVDEVVKPAAGLARSLRPRMRPSIVKAAAVVSPAPAAASASPEVDALKVPAGTRLVQLGAFDSAEVARKEWARLDNKFEDYLDGKQRIVMKAKSGGRVFYRLRAMGFADLSDSRRFCAALVAEKADCIPVTAK